MINSSPLTPYRKGYMNKMIFVKRTFQAFTIFLDFLFVANLPKKSSKYTHETYDLSCQVNPSFVRRKS